MKLVCVLLSAAALAVAQISSATLSGVVTDQTSAAVSGVMVEALQTETGFTRTTLTDTRGAYSFEGLRPGDYRIVAKKDGFADFQAGGIALELNQNARYDIRLAVGAARDQVTVNASVSPVDTASATIGYRMDDTRIADLPLESRNVIALVTLGPGAIPRQLSGFVHDVTNDVQEGSRGSVALNPPINGSRSTMNAFLLDGDYDTDRNTFAVAVYPPMDSVAEFHIQSSSAPAEYPSAGGGVIAVATKSGTRNLHGSAFEYFGSNAMDAREFFDDSTLPLAVFQQNDFGASLGGPVPKLKSTFFYGAYEGFRQKSGTSNAALVPDATTRAGNFSGQNEIFDPLSSTGDSPRAPFPGNAIPANRIDPIASAFLARFEPLPNSNSAAGNYLDTTPNIQNTDSASGRIDHQFSNHSLFTGHYTYNGEGNVIAGSFPLLPYNENVRAQQAALAYTASGAAWIDESRFSFTRLTLFDVPQSAFHDNIQAALGLANPPTNPLDFGLPFFNATDYSMVTDSPTLPQVQRDNLWQISNHASLVRGAHTIKFGGDYLRFQMNYLQSSQARGTYTYTGAFTSSDGSGVGSGDPFADFLLGAPQETAQTTGSGQAYLRENVYSAYIQDEWRVAPRLTVNFGVRWEYAAPFTEARDNLLNLNYSTLPNPPQLERVSSAVDPQPYNFAPRVGLAWQLPNLPRFGGLTVFRAAYGIFYSPEIAVEDYDLVLNGQLNELNETQGSLPPTLTTRNGFASTSVSGFPSYYGLDPHALTPYVQQWNASVQHELPRHVLLETAYIGSKGTHLGRYRQFNTPAQVETGADLPPRPGDLQSLRTWPSLGKIIQREHIANSSYNSLEVKVEKSMSSRLSLIASFVWSKSIDDADSVIPGLYDSVGAQDERNLRLERGLSFFNPGRRISAGYIWRLPETRVAGPVLRNWSLGGNVTLQDGTPLNVFYFGLDFANSDTPNRPNIVPGQSIQLPRGARSIEEFFNTAAFSAPAPYTFGDAGRDVGIGPGNNLFDFVLFRQFRITERSTVQFRAESFNAFNHPNWGIPDPNPDSGPFFGRIVAVGDPRRVQFALRYDF